MNYKKNVRFLLGFIAKKLNFSDFFRYFFIKITQIQFAITLDKNIEPYFRRSITGKSFVPFWSDIDITFIIKENDLSRLNSSLEKISKLIKFNYFVKDVEIIDGSNNLNWVDYSGYKNWTRSTWLGNQSTFLDKDLSQVSSLEICYNLIWEHRFLYEQLNLKLNALSKNDLSRIDLISAYKIIADIEKLTFFSKDRESATRESILNSYRLYPNLFKLFLQKEEYQNHLDFIVDKFVTLTNFLIRYFTSIFEKELNRLELPHQFKINQIDENITFFNFKCIFLNELDTLSMKSNLVSSIKVTVLTPQLYKIYKICGIQEIDFLLKLNTQSDYNFLEKYIPTRLLQDYIQAILEKKDETVLFFCRKNIDKFLYTRFQEHEALSYTKHIDETNLEHYVRVRDLILNMQNLLPTTNYVELIHGDKNYNDFLVVNWCFHTICNFKCTYCPTSLHDGAVRGPDLELVLKTCDNIIFQSNKEKFFFEFTGGEMTYYRKFTELMQELKKRDVETGIISNGSRDLKWWSEHRHLLDHICLSFHCEQGEADHFYNVVAFLNETVTTHVNIMMLPEKFEALHEFSKKLSSEIQGISISMQPLLENMAGSIFNYTEEQLRILSEHVLPWGTNLKHFPNPLRETKIYRGSLLKVNPAGESVETNSAELITNAENNWMDWQCWAGLENIVIDKDGSMYRGWCLQGGVIGSIFQDFELPKKPIHCKSQNCYCGLDIMATKKKFL